MYKKWIFVITSLLLLLPVSVYANEEVIVGGDSVGIEVGYDGVLITGTYMIENSTQKYDPSTVLKPGDIIKEINGTKITSLLDMQNEIIKYKQEYNQIPVKIIRNNTEIKENLITLFDSNSGSFKSGLYVKDKIVGVGTLTFYLPDNQTFGALGHEIYDMDLKQQAQIKSGTIYESNVSSISKGQPKIAGEKHAVIAYDKPLGTIEKNVTIGIYGEVNEKIDKERMEWANQDEIQLGEAQIYTVVNGDKVESFTIEITKLNPQDQQSIKGIEFIVTDDRLIAISGGIVQGMSGSPIVQNGKLVGAVTHVLCNTPEKGYGVYIEYMIEEAKKLR